MKHYPRTTLYMAAFLRRKWAPCRAWPVPSLLAWLQWFIDHNRYLLVMDGRRIAAVGLYRRLSDPRQLQATYADTNGPIVYIDVLASRGGKALKGCFNLLLRKEAKTATHISWVRGKCHDRFSMFPIARAASHLILT